MKTLLAFAVILGISWLAGYLALAFDRGPKDS